MNLLVVGDLHYRASTPRNRTDNYAETMAGKVRQILHIAVDYSCDHILAPGDFFDSHSPPLWLIGRALEERKSGPAWITVLGQHDQRHHVNAVENTPVGVLAAADRIRMAGKRPIKLTSSSGGSEKNVLVYGASWGEQIPKPDPRLRKDHVLVLLIHRMVVPSGPQWPGQEDFVLAEDLLARHPFDLIVSGDNHQFFVRRHHKKILVNCGSLMRMTVAQENHEPSVVVYDTNGRVARRIKLRVAPSTEVFKTIQKEQTDPELEAFVNQVRGNTRSPGLSFTENVRKLLDTGKVPDGVRKKVEQILGLGAENGH